MFFATAAHPLARRYAYAHAGRGLERFLQEAARPGSSTACSTNTSQDETAYTLSLDVPGIAKDQLSIAIEGTVVRISSKEGAPRRYQAAYEFPLEIDTATSEAKLENGVLTLKLVKKLPVSNVTELTVH
ncbi:MAG: Hsp20/alpha crystallin family protein [Rhodoferax sp.]